MLQASLPEINPYICTEVETVVSLHAVLSRVSSFIQYQLLCSGRTRTDRILVHLRMSDRLQEWSEGLFLVQILTNLDYSRQYAIYRRLVFNSRSSSTVVGRSVDIESAED